MSNQETSKPVPMTLRAVRDALSALTSEQLDQPAKWWGEGVGGEIYRVDVLGEDHVCMDESYGFEPASVYTVEEQIDAEERLPAGTVFLGVDE